MNWNDYSKIANGIYIPQNNKPMSNKAKFVVSEGLSPKNLLKVPGKLNEERGSMENDLRRFVGGKSILNEIAPAVPLAIAAAPAILGATETAAVGAGLGAAGTGAATTGAAATGASAVGTAGTGEVAANVAAPVATSLATDSVAPAAAESGIGSQIKDAAAQQAISAANDATQDSNEDTSAVKKSGL